MGVLKLAKTKKRVKPGKQSKQTISPILIGIVSIASILLVAGLIILGNQTQNTGEPADVSQFPSMGNADAPVTIIEFSDYG